MKCQCICNCTNEADDDIAPKLCTTCRLCEDIDESANPKHGLPYVPTVWPTPEPAVKVTPEQWDKVYKTWADENL